MYNALVRRPKAQVDVVIAYVALVPTLLEMFPRNRQIKVSTQGGSILEVISGLCGLRESCRLIAIKLLLDAGPTIFEILARNRY